MSISADIKKLFRRLKREGWGVAVEGKHYKLRHPLGGFVTTSISPSCPHAIKHILGDIKRLEKENARRKEQAPSSQRYRQGSPHAQI